MPGHRFDTVGVAPLIDGLGFEGFIADKAFDSNSIMADLNERGTKIVISQHPRRASLRMRRSAIGQSWAGSVQNLSHIRSCDQRQPHLSTCTMPLITRRSSALSTPRTSVGKCGSIRAHCSSLSRNRFLLMNPSPNTNQYLLSRQKD
jgi:hypothetical protein